MAQTKVGECEVCIEPKGQVRITNTPGNIWMCDECKAKEDKLQAENMTTEAQNKRINEMLARSRQIDQSIQLVADIHNAATIPAVELKATIDADDSIPADQKHYRYTEECYNRFQQFKKTVFEKRTELLEAENAMRAWQTTVRTSAASLSAELREKFKAEDLTYTPATPKTVKPGPSKGGKKKASKEELYAAAQKYDVPAQAVAMIATAKNLTVEQAARHSRLKQDGKECDCPACMKLVVKS